MTAIAKIPKIPKATVRFIVAAKKAGVPEDWVRLFLKAGYIPQPKQLEFHAAAASADLEDGPIDIGFGGARGPGKTHATFAQVALVDCKRIKGLKVLFLRKVSKAANEAVEDLRSSVLFKTPHRYKEQKSTIIFPNRSRIILGHFQYEKDIDNYLGLEYDIIVIEEGTQLSKSKIDKIKTCNRSAKEGFRPRRYYTTNPGGVGHQWFKEKFISPFRDKTEKNNQTKFIPATAKDNKKLNKDYIKTVLEPLTGWLREAWLNGNWDVFAGQFFSNFSYDRHVLKPSQMPQPKKQNLEVWCSLDYGYKHWMVTYLFCKFDGITYILDELAMRKTLISEYCRNIKEMLQKHDLGLSDLANFYAGTDVFGKDAKTGESYADVFAQHGVHLKAANTSREQGWGKMLQMFGDANIKDSEGKPQPIEPTVKISSDCPKLIECLPILEHNPDKPNDVLKVDTDDEGNGGDDPGDAARYGLNVTNSTGVFL